MSYFGRRSLSIIIGLTREGLPLVRSLLFLISLLARTTVAIPATKEVTRRGAMLLSVMVAGGSHFELSMSPQTRKKMMVSGQSFESN
jgi:hypothetical protein